MTAFAAGRIFACAAPPPAAFDESHVPELEELASQLASTYRVERELGAGGMATVYLAQDLKHGREVAIKVLRPELSAMLGAERFLREIAVTASLQHPHILPLFDSGDAGGRLYYVMPRIRGESLRQRLERERLLPIADALRIASEVADALAYAHAHGVVHRDVKPENILLQDEHALVSDFGIALVVDHPSGPRITRTGFSVGTPQYMAPEQAMGDQADARADVYALGCVLYEMLVGEPPFAGATARAIAARRMHGEWTPVQVIRPSVPDAVARLLDRALASYPADRCDAATMARVLDDARPSSADLPTVAMPSRERTGARKPRRLVGAAVAMLAIVVIVAGTAIVAPQPRQAILRAISPDRSPRVRSLAVLPFVRLGADSARDYFSDGMTEELTNVLGQLGVVRVIARSSAFALGAGATDAREAGRRLGVDGVIEGAVRRAGGVVRITASLVDARTGEQVTSWAFERAESDVLQIQSEIASAIAGALRAQLTAPPVRRARSADPRAYDLFLRARDVRVPLERRIALLEQAIRVDSTLAAAHALIARLLVNQNVLSDTATLRDVIARAKQEAAQAIALDSTSVEALTTLAVLRFRYDWQWADAERLHLRAIALNPSDPDAHRAYARTLRSFGRFDECQREYLTADALDPLGADRAMSRGRAFYFARDYERALRFYLSLFARDSTNSRLFLFENFLMLRRFDEAEQELRRRGPPATLPTHYAAVWAAAGRAAEARALLRPLERATAPVQSYEAALAYAALGDRDGAMRWLRRAYEERDDRMVDLKVEPRLDPLRSDPRFLELMQRMRFPP